MYKDLRFFGHYISDARGWEMSQAAMDSEMKARAPDKNAPQGYQADLDFKKEVSRFGADYREMARDTIKRAREGEKISRDEYVTVVRGEKLYALASAAGPGVAEHRLSMLESGRHAFEGHGMSDTRMLGKLTGYDKEAPRDHISVRFELGR